MANKKKTEDEKIQSTMFSVRDDQYARITKIAKKEKRSRRAVFDILMDEHEAKGKKS